MSERRKRVYSSIEEYTAEFCEGFNPLLPQNMYDLWHSIMNHSEASAELAGEGNSGEFHDENEEKKLKKQRDDAEVALIDKFAAVTGYRPVFVKNPHPNIIVKNKDGVPYSTYYIGAWDFKKEPKTKKRK